MADTTAPIVVPFEGDGTGFEKAAKGVETTIDKLGKQIQKVGIGVGLAKLSGVLDKANDAASTQIDAQRRLSTAIVTSGKNIDQSQLQSLASRLQSVTQFGDEATIKMMAFATSMGFSEREILALTPRVADLAASLGVSMDDALKKVKMAVSAGSGAFNEMGVSITASEKKLFDQSDATGRLSQAMKLLDRSVGGLAEGLTKTSRGAFTQFENQAGDLAETFGMLTESARMEFWQKMTSVIRGLTGVMENLTPGAKTVVTVLATAVPILVAAGSAAAILAGVLPSVAAGFQMIFSATKSLAAPLVSIVLVIGTIAMAAAALRLAWEKNWGGMQDKVRGVLSTIIEWWQSTGVTWAGFVDGIKSAARTASDILIEVFMAPSRAITFMVTTAKKGIATVLDMLADLAASPIAAKLGLGGIDTSGLTKAAQNLRVSAAIDSAVFDEKVQILKEMVAEIPGTTMTALEGLPALAKEAGIALGEGFALLGDDFLRGLEAIIGKDAMDALRGALAPGAAGAIARPDLVGGGLKKEEQAKLDKEAKAAADTFAKSLEDLRTRVDIINRGPFRDLSTAIVSAEQDLVSLAKEAAAAGADPAEALALRRQVAADEIKTALEGIDSLQDFRKATDQARTALEGLDIDPSTVLNGIDKKAFQDSLSGAMGELFQGGTVSAGGAGKAIGAVAGKVSGMGAAAGAMIGGFVGAAIPMVLGAVQQLADGIVQAAAFIPDLVAKGVDRLADFTGDERLKGGLAAAFNPAAGMAIVITAAVIAVEALAAVSAVAASILGGPFTWALLAITLPLMILIGGFTAVASAALLVGAGLFTLYSGLFALAMQTKTMEDVQAAFGASVDRVISALEPVADGFFAIVGLFDAFVDVLLPFADAMGANDGAARALFEAFKMVAVGTGIFLFSLGVIVGVFGSGVGAMLFAMATWAQGIATFTQTTWTLRDTLATVAVSMLIGVRDFLAGMGILTQTLEGTLVGAANTINSTIGQGGIAQSVADALFGLSAAANGLGPDLEAMGSALVDLADLTYDEAYARGKELVPSIEEETAARQESVNVPQGFKELASRFRSIDAEDLSPATQPGGTGESGSPMPPTQITINIDKLLTEAADGKMLVESVKKESERQYMMVSGASSVLWGNG